MGDRPSGTQVCPLCYGTGKCPVCGNYKENRLKQVAQVVKNLEQEIFDLTHEKEKKGMKKIPKWVMLDSIDKVRHVSSLKSYLADLKEIIKDV